ncbi:MAG: TIGR03915 family putative DNA repair protein [Lachnospiraceae bacterium]|nr:TIGR03915 family putative DNA repair protein [Lachnospiraceae bacterium]
MVVCCCDGTVDGILTAVFDAWAAGVNDSRISIGKGNIEWFADYIDVVTDSSKASRVAAKVIDVMGYDAYEMIYFAAVSGADDRGEAIFGFIRKGLRIGRSIVSDLHDKYVMRVFELHRSSQREYQHVRGFLRFRDYKGYLIARIEPKNNICEILMQFFEDRLKQERFMIIDVIRGVAGVYDGNAGYMTGIDDDMLAGIRNMEITDEFGSLWNVFEDNIAIKPRYNPKLQQQNLPLRFRKYM